jgi:hypothetical protein
VCSRGPRKFGRSSPRLKFGSAWGSDNKSIYTWTKFIRKKTICHTSSLVLQVIMSTLHSNNGLHPFPCNNYMLEIKHRTASCVKN